MQQAVTAKTWHKPHLVQRQLNPGSCHKGHNRLDCCCEAIAVDGLGRGNVSSGSLCKSLHSYPLLTFAPSPGEWRVTKYSGRPNRRLNNMWSATAIIGALHYQLQQSGPVVLLAFGDIANRADHALRASCSIAHHHLPNHLCRLDAAHRGICMSVMHQLRSAMATSAINQDWMRKAAFADKTIGCIKVSPKAPATFEVELDHIDDISGHRLPIRRHRPCGGQRYPANGHFFDDALFNKRNKILWEHSRGCFSVCRQYSKR